MLHSLVGGSNAENQKLREDGLSSEAMLLLCNVGRHIASFNPVFPKQMAGLQWPKSVNLVPKCQPTDQQVMQRGLTASEGGLGSSSEYRGGGQ